MMLTRPLVLLALLLLLADAMKAAAADAPPGTASLTLFMTENENAERSIIDHLLRGDSPDSPAMLQEARQLVLLQADLLSVGFTGPTPALEATADREVAARVLLQRMGLAQVTPWSLLAGKTLAFKRGRP